MTDAVLSVRGLSKKYATSLRDALWYALGDIARELVAANGNATLRPREFWALDDVSFEVARGSALAVVGANGAGKSTLLKVLFGLLKPDRGEVQLRGRAEAMLELGTGFNPLLTGRENARLAATLHGMRRGRDAEPFLERVADFAELGEFFDAPLQSYSAGMRARLSYAVAAQLEADILLVDEVLAVGDLAFQRKCAAHMLSWINRGGALLLVSHNTFQVQSVCREGILLDRGRIAFRGSAIDTLGAFVDAQARTSHGGNSSRTSDASLAIETIDAEALTPHGLETGTPVRIALRYRAETAMRAMWGFSIWSADQWVCITGDFDLEPRLLAAGRGTLACTIPRLPLLAGNYALRGALIDPDTLLPLATFGWSEPATSIAVHTAPTLLRNAQVSVQQLVTLDVDWS